MSYDEATADYAGTGVLGIETERELAAGDEPMPMTGVPTWTTF